MPIYEYQCPDCKQVFEKKQGFADAACAECPGCQKKARRIFRPVPIIFKGSGFYVTDHGKPSTPEKSQETAKKGK
ncbi:MAG: FmdB family zinc ribbon protein [Chloroflexota bacterium]